MERIELLINKYIKKQKPKILHDLRVEARRILSNLEKEGKIDLGLKTLLKNSSKLRDADVMLKICKDKEVKKYLKKKRKKLIKRFIKFLENFESKIVELENKKEYINCKEILNDTFLNKDDKTLHKIRIKIKKCRYTNEKYENELKILQDFLGKAHDYYNCERLLLKFNKNPKKAIKKKKKFIKKAENERIKLLNIIP